MKSFSWNYSRLQADDDDGDKNNDEHKLFDIEDGRKFINEQFNEGTKSADIDVDDRSKTFQLKQRNAKKIERAETIDDLFDYITYQVNKDDTLQGIALKCRSTVNDLKRLNNLVSDQDFHGLRCLKIPIKRCGLLSEVIAHQNAANNGFLASTSPRHSSIATHGAIESPLSSTKEPNELADGDYDGDDCSSALVINVGLKKTFQFDENDHDMNRFLCNLDRDLQKIRKCTDNYNQRNTNLINLYDDIESSTAMATVSTLSTADAASMAKYSKSTINCDGADCGIKWSQIFLIAIILLVLVPVIYAFVVSKNILY